MMLLTSRAALADKPSEPATRLHRFYHYRIAVQL